MASKPQINLPAVLRNLADHPEAFFEDSSCVEYLRQAAHAIESCPRPDSTNPPKAASIAPEQGRVVPADDELSLEWVKHRDCDCLDCRPWTS